jgi:predicted metalloprotease
MLRVTWRGAASILVVLIVLAGCSGGGGTAAVKSSSPSPSSESTSSSSSSSDDVVPGKTTFGPDDDDAIITKAVDDVQAFYEDLVPTLYGTPFQPLSGGTFPYGPSDPPPECGGRGKSDYRDVAQNAFYCPPSDFMAWDTVNLTNDLLDNFGPFTLAIVVAHELGHAIEARHGILDGRFITFVTEQQADCFAGAYTQHVQQGGSKNFTVELSDLDNAIGGFLLIRDPVGTDTVNDTAAHGSAFQRINAFEDGLQGGGEKCKSYEEESFNFVPESFDPGDINPELTLNLPFPEVEPLVVANLEGFWTAAFNDIGKTWTTARINAFDPAQGVTCDGRTKKGDDAVGLVFYCSPDDTLNWDEKRLMPAVYELGDLAEAVVIANEYSSRAQHLAGLPTDSLDTRLQVDCFTGVWVATTKTNEINKTLPEEAQLFLSPGDLDEAVSAFLEFSKATASESGESTAGSAFQHLDAFRTGFFTAFNEGYTSGLTKCVNNGASAEELESSNSSSSASSSR